MVRTDPCYLPNGIPSLQRTFLPRLSGWLPVALSPGITHPAGNEKFPQKIFKKVEPEADTLSCLKGSAFAKPERDPWLPDIM